MPLNLKINFKNVLFILLFVVVVGATFYVGFYVGKSQQKLIFLDGTENIDATDVADFSLLWEAWDTVKNVALKGAEVKNEDLLFGTVSGLVGALDDPYSTFFRPSDAKKFQEDISGVFGGIGAEIGIKNKQLVIIAPLKGSPTERAGLQSSDQIWEVDGKSTQGLSVEESVKMIRGNEGTTVKLLIYREGWTEAKDYSIVRERIVTPTIETKRLDDGILHVQLYNFNNNATTFFSDSIKKEGLNGGMKGIILDLRNNPGGYLDQAVEMAGLFLERGTLVVYEEMRGGEKTEFFSRGGETLKNVPAVVLINEGSASASEILAGALRDQRGIKLIGSTSFGKGTVQQLEQLRNGAMLKLTIAHWLLPKGDLIEGNGIKPDYEVEQPKGENSDEKDLQLEKAIEVLKGEISKKDTLFIFE